jgi:transposase
VSQRLPIKEFEKQYKNHLSGFLNWEQKEHAEHWILCPENIGDRLSIDEVAISNDELYTVLTNKQAHGRKGALVAMVKGTKAEDIAAILGQIPFKDRARVNEVTMDFSPSMELAVQRVFIRATIVTDRFHVQHLVAEALQEMRIEERWKAIKEENRAVKESREQRTTHRSKTYANGDTKKQLLARSRYVLFKPENKWTENQRERARTLFTEFPDLRSAYRLSMNFRSIYEHATSRVEAKEYFKAWYAKVDEKNFAPLVTTAEYIAAKEQTILNYFPNRSTNASAESFNSKLKGFRALVRGVRDTPFFLFRLVKLYG